jgi:hypothetical protein
MIVQCNRTESLDASHNAVMQGQVTLPKVSDMTREFAKHLHNVAKRLEENEETGSKRYIYVKLGEDHFRHAWNYERIASAALNRPRRRAGAWGLEYLAQKEKPRQPKPPPYKPIKLRPGELR